MRSQGGDDMLGVAMGEGLAQLLVQLVLSCLVTAVVEELVFRGLLASLFARKFCGPRGLLNAAAASAFVFALLHVASDALRNVADAALLLQAVLKLAQTGLFGFIMACLFLKARAKGSSFARALTFPILIHWAFDVVYFGPVYLSTGAFPSTYLTGASADTALLLITSLLMLPLCALAARRLSDEVLLCSTKNDA